MKRKTAEEFIKDARKIYGNKYDYSKVEYVNSRTPVTIICPEHGEFQQSPNAHLRGKGCIKCAGTIKSTTEEFVAKAKLVHGDKYDYSKVKYVNANTPVDIICPEHGEFQQRPHDHLSGRSGCPKCANNLTLTTEEFISKAKAIHGDKYNYSKVVYVNNHTPVTIICPKHGEFQQIPMSHLKGSGCPKCCGKNSTTEDFIRDARKIHGNKYDYSKVEYVNSRTPVTIICPEHGEFQQIPYVHFGDKCGCPKCANNLTLTTEEFISKAKAIHGDKYNYSKVVYVNNHTPVTIICPKHGEFQQRPNDHLCGKGCSKCNEYKGEKITEKALENLNVLFVYDKGLSKIFKLLNIKSKYPKGKKMYRFDFTLLSNNKKKVIGLVEFDGEQHFNARSSKFYKTPEDFLQRVTNDHEKTVMSEVMNIPLLRIRYDQLDTETVSDIIDDFWDSIQKGDGRYLTQHNPYLTNEEYFREANEAVAELTLENA